MGAVVCFTLGIWPRFRFWSLLIAPALCMGLLFTLVLHEMVLGLVCMPLNYARGRGRGGNSRNSKAPAAGGGPVARR